MPYKTVGIIIIGDEILKGYVKDVNSGFLCERLYSLGIKTCKISVISDNLDDICREVSIFSAAYDAVITTGGVGPTHDDVTYEGVAKAFDESVYLNEEMRRYFANYLVPRDDNGLNNNNNNNNHNNNNSDSNNSLLRMVIIPRSSQVLTLNVGSVLGLDRTYYPIVKVRNVFVLPGVPQLVLRLFADLEKTYFASSGNMFYNRVVYLNRDENVTTASLNKVVDRYKDTVVFGSYPQCDSNLGYETKITIESSVMEDCLAAEFALLMELPPSWIVHVKNSTKPLDYGQFSSFLKTENSLTRTVLDSLKIIEECLEKYDLSKVFVSFNGGKDGTVMLFLICYVYHQKAADLNSGPLKTLYSLHENAFEEETQFVYECAQRYNLNLSVIKGSVKESLQSFINDNPDTGVSFLGTRRSDPGGENLKPYQMTDEGWPQIFRVFPILEWTYDDIWNFLRAMNIPYCCLYNYGYTSIGTKDNTSANQDLRCTDVYDGRVYYKPAYLLGKISSERQGRSLQR